MARLAGQRELEDGQLARICALAAMHDAGKCNVTFQNRIFPGRQPRGSHLRELLGVFAGSWAGSPIQRQLLEALGFFDILDWADDEQRSFELFVAVVSHHGRPVSVLDSTFSPSLWKPAHGLDPLAGLATLRDAVRSWFPSAFADARRLQATAPFQHAVSGLVTLADWLGSDERFFPFSEDGEEDRMELSRERAKQAVAGIGLGPARWRAVLEAKPPSFASVSPFSPRWAQESLLRLPCRDGGSLSILESDTGSGKTEAALARFLVLFHAGLVDGLYFALPTRTAATQIFHRVREVTRRAFPRDPPPVVLAVPGYYAVDEVEGQRLPDFVVLWDDPDQVKWRVKGWAAEHPKRYLAGAVVVGTIDQVLLSALAVSHADMRASALLRQLLVVDEVHASDAYMTKLLEAVLAHHLDAGGHALLMSATLGATARSSLLKAGRAGEQSSLKNALALPYPLISDLGWSDGGRPIEQSPSRNDPEFTGTPNKTIGVHLAPIMEETRELVELGLNAARAGARVLIIRNTVAGCVATQLALEELCASEVSGLLFRCRGIPAPHHSRYAPADRRALDEAIEEAFGKESRRGGRIAVATQTVQQSLDLDADLMISDLCPMDVLLQRVGRLHRHSGRPRPPGYESPTLVVLVPATQDLGEMLGCTGAARGPHGLGTVYHDLRVLEATWRELRARDEIHIPLMNRELVERATHPEALAALVEELGGPWPRHTEDVAGRWYAHRMQGHYNLIDRRQAFGDYQLGDRAIEGSIRTRLGTDDRVVHFGSPVPGAFVPWIAHLTVPGHMLPDGCGEPIPEKVDATPPVLRFHLAGRCFCYDRVGLRRESD